MCLIVLDFRLVLLGLFTCWVLGLSFVSFLLGLTGLWGLNILVCEVWVFVDLIEVVGCWFVSFCFLFGLLVICFEFWIWLTMGFEGLCLRALV